MTSVLLPEGELRVARCDTLDKLIAVGDGDAALLYIYILRHGEVDGRTAARALHLSEERYERAAFTLNNLSTPASQTKAAEKAENAAPQYTAAELRRARNEDSEFSAVCDAAENAFGRALTEGMLRSLLTAYDHLGLDGGAIIELLSYLKNEKGEVRLSDIKRETYQWADMGIVNAQDAQQYLARRVGEKPFVEAVYRALGADPAQPAPKEQRARLPGGGGRAGRPPHGEPSGPQEPRLHARHSAPLGRERRARPQRNHRARAGEPQHGGGRRGIQG